MNVFDVLRNEERALYSLRRLYMEHGYTRYKVSKFEEYDLYAGNKSFLISEHILTFTDTNGKLMALKPDITLSIVKNVRTDDTDTHKVYYNENVYRTAAGSDGFREILQTGLEYIGQVDDAAVGEVLTLAQKSLSIISNDYILDLSHMGFVTGLLEAAGVDAEKEAKLLSLVESKNTSAIRSICASYGISEEDSNALCRLTDLYEPLERALPKIRDMVKGEKMREAYEQLCAIAGTLAQSGDTSRLYLDFSIVNDMNYYDGIIFRGYINGIPDGILSGGRYDKLLARMGKKSGAIGFAVYLDLLERLENTADEREE